MPSHSPNEHIRWRPRTQEVSVTWRHRSAEAAEWAEKAIEQRDPNIIPATCGPNRKFFRSAGRWPALARGLNLPETATGQSDEGGM